MILCYVILHYIFSQCYVRDLVSLLCAVLNLCYVQFLVCVMCTAGVLDSDSEACVQRLPRCVACHATRLHFL